MIIKSLGGYGQKGVVEAIDEFELMAFAESLSCYPRNINGRIGIITGSGGHGALCTDACISHGLVVPGFNEETQLSIKEVLSPVLSNIASYATLLISLAVQRTMIF